MPDSAGQKIDWLLIHELGLCSITTTIKKGECMCHFKVFFSKLYIIVVKKLCPILCLLAFNFFTFLILWSNLSTHQLVTRISDWSAVWFNVGRQADKHDIQGHNQLSKLKAESPNVLGSWVYCHTRKIVGQTWLFNLDKKNNPGEGKLWIQTSYILLKNWSIHGREFE